MSNLRASRRAAAKWFRKNQGNKDIFNYAKRSHLGLQKKKWTSEELKEYRDSQEQDYLGQSAPSLFRRIKRRLLNVAVDAELKVQAKIDEYNETLEAEEQARQDEEDEDDNNNP